MWDYKCPFCKEKLQHLDAELKCSKCKRKYCIRDGIPIFVVQPAQEVEKIRCFFEDQAKKYGNKGVFKFHMNFQLNKNITYSFLNGLGKSKKILDFGCGSGLVSRDLKDAKHSVIGCDISFNMLQLAKKNGVETFMGNENSIPFDEEYFDVILCNEVIQHIDNKRDFFHKIAKYLKYDGILLVSTISRISILRYISRLFLNPKILTQGVSVRDIKGFCKKSSLQIEKIAFTYFPFHIYRIKKAPNFFHDPFCSNLIMKLRKTNKD